MNSKHRSRLWFAGVLAVAALAACEQQGPVERLGEEVDEAVDTVRDGEESVATKVDDAVDELRD
jgi:predicted small lipoprotein YifL